MEPYDLHRALRAEPSHRGGNAGGGHEFLHRSAHRPQYFTYVTEELPAILRKHFPLSEKPEENYICGLSMGGFGASKCAFNYPERYGAVGLMSTGPINPIQLEEIFSAATGRPPRTDRHQVLFGGTDKIPGSVNDTWYVLEKAIREGKKIPPIFDCCGTDDLLYQAFTMFREFAKDLPLDITYAEAPGAHNWDFWDAMLPKFFDWLPLKHRDYWQKWNRENAPLLADKKRIDDPREGVRRVGETEHQRNG